MITVSDKYKKIDGSKRVELFYKYGNAWQDPNIPSRQYEACVKPELEAFRQFMPIAPFDALRVLLNRIPEANQGFTRVLDIGASSGYYKEVLDIIGFKGQYTALDNSEHFMQLAEDSFPGINFRLGNADDLPFPDNWFEIILHSACLMHVATYEKAVGEAARVARQYVIFHRTPIFTDLTPTEAWEKEAYGVKCLEWKFNEIELLNLFSKNNLGIVTSTDIFKRDNFAHRCYLLKKVA